MVFTGKPSTGCQMCRNRRIKCDETKPSCEQCLRTGRMCPGYRNVVDAMFRNTTGAIVAQRRPRPGRSTAGPGRGRHHSQCTSSATDVIIPALHGSPRQLATCHFFSNFVLVPCQGSSRGYMDYLVPLMRDAGPAVPASEPLRHAFDACALASMGARVTSDGFNFTGEALGAYTRALATTYTALRDATRALEDTTLAAVLLLSLFESISAKQMGMYAWGSHVEGAIQLVQARGRDQIKTEQGLSLFIAVRTQMIIHGTTSGKPPVMGAEWWLRGAVCEAAAAECQRLSIQTAEERATANQYLAATARTAEDVARVRDLVQRVARLERACQSWGRHLPPLWQPQTVAWEEGRRIDVYCDMYVASVWNMMRCTRLSLSTIAVRCAAWDRAPADYRTTPEYAAATRTCSDVIADIIAGVPFHLGWQQQHRDVVKAHFEKQPRPGFACGDETGHKGLAGYFLAWPLANVNNQDYASDAERAWVAGRLRYIANDLGVRYAGILAGLQIRVPSMLIRRDKLAAQQQAGASHGRQVLLTAATAQPVAGYTLNPLQQWEALQKQSYENDQAELLATAGGGSGPSGHWVAKRLLQMSDLLESVEKPDNAP